MVDIEMQKKIEHYIQGRIGPEEEDHIWIQFLENPKWFEYFNTLLGLHAIASKTDQLD
jgi:hypothetical protein